MFKMIDEIKTETKVAKFINLTNLFCIIGFVVFGYVMSNAVYSTLRVPFIIFNGIVGLILSVHSPFNRGKRIAMSAVFFVNNSIKEKNSYSAIDIDDYEEDVIEQNNYMYKKLEEGDINGKADER